MRRVRSRLHIREQGSFVSDSTKLGEEIPSQVMNEILEGGPIPLFDRRALIQIRDDDEVVEREVLGDEPPELRGGWNSPYKSERANPVPEINIAPGLDQSRDCLVLLDKLSEAVDRLSIRSDRLQVESVSRPHAPLLRVEVEVLPRDAFVKVDVEGTLSPVDPASEGQDDGRNVYRSPLTQGSAPANCTASRPSLSFEASCEPKCRPGLERI